MPHPDSTPHDGPAGTPAADPAEDHAADRTADLADDAPLDPAESLRIIAAQTEKVRGREPDERVIFGAWGTAWLLGYLALYLTASGRLGSPATQDGVDLPAGWAFAVFGSLLIAAMVVTVAHSVRANAGVQGVSSTFGAMYGCAWFLGFVGMSGVLAGLSRAGASPEVLAIASNACACLVVGVLYLAGGAFWRDRSQYAIGVWIILVAAGAALTGLPTTYLVMAVLGGGGFFVGMVVSHVLRRGRTPESVRHARTGASS